MEPIDDMLACRGKIERAGLCKEHLVRKIRLIYTEIMEHRNAINLLQMDLQVLEKV